MAKARLTEDVMFEMFDYATSAREETMAFVEGETSSAYWLKMLYDPKANKFARKLLRENGVKGTRSRLRRMYNKMNGKNCW